MYSPSETPLEKTKVSFVSIYQLTIVSGLGKGLMPTSPFSAETPSVADLCSPWASCQSVSAAVSRGHWTFFFGVLDPFCLLQSFCLFFFSVPSILGVWEGKDLMRPSRLELSIPRSLTLCTLAHRRAVALCICSHLLHEEASQMMTDQGTSLEYSRKSLIVLWLYSFSRTVVFCLPLCLRPFWSQVVGHLINVGDWYHLIAMVLNKIRYGLFTPPALHHYCLA